MCTTPQPAFHLSRNILLAGTMVIYDSHAEATEKIPAQWRSFLSRSRREFAPPEILYGASPCTNDGKLHFLCGAELSSSDGANGPDRLTLEEGEYAVFTVDDFAALRDTWIWVLSEWLPTSDRKERNAPEFERYLSGTPTSGPVDLWIPLAAR